MNQSPDSQLGPEAQQIENILGHKFLNVALLREALTHRSALYERSKVHGSRKKGTPLYNNVRGAGSNERLEFIGDRVLGLIVAEWLFERYPDEQEGQLGLRHAHLVSRMVLASIARQIGLSRALLIAEHEERSGVRKMTNVLADALEAVIGALYMDAGIKTSRQFIRKTWEHILVEHIRPPKDAKTALQEWLLARDASLPCYEVLSIDGPAHAPNFRVVVSAAGKSGKGSAKNKRTAESLAATDLLNKLQSTGNHFQ